MRIRKLKQTVIGIILIVVCAALVVASLRIYYLEPSHQNDHIEQNLTELAAQGERIFESSCSKCHYPDRTETKIGPGLKGLFDGETLPVSGRKVSEENVRSRLSDPYESMPSFEDMGKEKEDAVIAYLKTL